MNFYAIVNKENEGFFINAATSKLETLTSECLFPTEEMANEYVGDHLAVNRHLVVKVTIHRIVGNDVEWSHDDVAYW